jgi:hypothetical protein
MVRSLVVLRFELGCYTVDRCLLGCWKAGEAWELTFCQAFLFKVVC